MLKFYKTDLNFYKNKKGEQNEYVVYLFQKNLIKFFEYLFYFKKFIKTFL